MAMKQESSPMVCQEQLSELDKSFLKKWEHASSMSTRSYAGTSSDTKPQASDVDAMSAGLSALLLLDDIIDMTDKNSVAGKFPLYSPRPETNIDDLQSAVDNFDLLFDVDIDCIDLDLSLLESYSSDLFKDDTRSGFS